MPELGENARREIERLHGPEVLHEVQQDLARQARQEEVAWTFTARANEVRFHEPLTVRYQEDEQLEYKEGCGPNSKKAGTMLISDRDGQQVQQRQFIVSQDGGFVQAAPVKRNNDRGLKKASANGDMAREMELRTVPTLPGAIRRHR